ncbi:protein lingerer-like [Paramacrobiotus metropolitanus]|uniref:protein lingerer-like n=1 Tax=Paramacrobiotus metropolitanus TaxID=2943436 RepID=UPI0024456556|nr:protein lingerer-like [Paramacrobiotus metropolitanus]
MSDSEKSSAGEKPKPTKKPVSDGEDDDGSPKKKAAVSADAVTAGEQQSLLQQASAGVVGGASKYVPPQMRQMQQLPLQQVLGAFHSLGGFTRQFSTEAATDASATVSLATLTASQKLQPTRQQQQHQSAGVVDGANTYVPPPMRRMQQGFGAFPRLGGYAADGYGAGQAVAGAVIPGMMEGAAPVTMFYPGMQNAYLAQGMTNPQQAYTAYTQPSQAQMYQQPQRPGGAADAQHNQQRHFNSAATAAGCTAAGSTVVREVGGAGGYGQQLHDGGSSGNQLEGSNVQKFTPEEWNSPLPRDHVLEGKLYRKSDIDFDKFKDTEVKISDVNGLPNSSYSRISLHAIIKQNMELAGYKDRLAPVQSYARSRSGNLCGKSLGQNCGFFGSDCIAHVERRSARNSHDAGK